MTWLGNIIFITGGVRSGKSAFAESYAIQQFQKHNKEDLYYLASGVAFDEEMVDRIKRHQQDRTTSIVKWKTIDIIDKIPTKLTFSSKDVVLWDCITTWLSNVLYKTERDENRIQKIEQYVTLFKQKVLAWGQAGAQLLIVSNEVLDEPSSPYDEANLYRKMLGDIHRWLVSVSTKSYEVDYCIVHRWK